MQRVVLVTGADHGLGFALVEKYIQLGATVVAGKFMRNPGKLEVLKKTSDEKLHIMQLDISNADSVKEAAFFFQNNFHHLDILINNAGILGDIEKTIFDNLDYEDIAHTFDVNTLGPLRMINYFIPFILRSEEKCIVNISSEAGSIANCERKNWFGYTMSKCALNMQATLVQNQLRGHGVKVYLFHPGWMKTYMNGRLNEDAPTLPEEAAERIISRIEHVEEYHFIKPPYIDNDTGEILPW